MTLNCTTTYKNMKSYLDQQPQVLNPKTLSPDLNHKTLSQETKPCTLTLTSERSHVGLLYSNEDRATKTLSPNLNHKTLSQDTNPAP